MIVIGVDPDAQKHGVAVYQNGTLVDLKMLETFDLVHLAANMGAAVAVEDVMANQFVYSRNQKQSKAAQSKVAMSIGRAQQAQVELCRMLDRYGINYQLFKPQRGNWAKSRAVFEKVTGWEGQSNEDTRAAAFFGFLMLGNGFKGAE